MMRSLLKTLSIVAILGFSGTIDIDAQVAASSPTTNVGAAPNSNVQNANITMRFIDHPASVDPLSGTVTMDHADALLNSACVPATVANLGVLDDQSTYALINIIRLAPSADGNRQVSSNNWYVYAHNKKPYQGFLHGWTIANFDGATRLYGAKHVLVATLVLGAQFSDSNSIAYAFTVTKTIPTNLASVEALLGAVFPAAGPGGDEAPPEGDAYIGCATVPIAYSTSSIKIDTVYPSSSASPQFKNSVTFTNEAMHYVDVSFALPVKKASALQYDSTANTITASQINKQSLFAVVDLYVPPHDLNASGYSFFPHIFGGVAMNSQPLHSLIFGGAVGLHLAEVYAGVLLLKQQQLSGLSVGSSATPTQLSSATSYAFKPSFSVGVMMSISTGVKAFSNAK